MNTHSKSALKIIQLLDSNPSSGLTENQVQEQRVRYGKNKLREKKRKSNFSRFLEQFKDAMILILIAAAIISFVIACIEGDPKEFFEPALILLIVVLNATMGVMQESKAQKALDALKSLSAPHARVIRDGKEKIIDAVELVPGDIIRLEAGDFIPADARLLQSVSLKSEESALTGESVPSEKDASTIVDERAALVSALLIVLVLFTPLSTLFGFVALTPGLYLKGLVLILVPILVMELSKACGLIKHQH